MSITKNIGGDRLGSGSKMQVQMHNYERSTHDLSSVWRSSMQVGVLTPFMVEVGLNGDTFDIDLTAMVRTLPTISPLYGSFKLQMDVFEIPMRLYNGILHNNALKIGNDMQKVKFPKLKFDVKVGNTINTNTPFNISQISGDSLMAYLGLRGFGLGESINYQDITRYINAVPVLAYYDVFKNYYANKQEENAYIIGAAPKTTWVDPIISVWSPDFGRKPNIDTSVEWTMKPNYIYTINGDNLDISGLTIDGDGFDVFSSNPQYTSRGGISFTADLLTSDWSIPGQAIVQTTTNNVSAEIDLIPFEIDNIDKMRVDILKATGLDEAIEINKETAYLPYSQIVKRTTGGTNYNFFTMNGLCLKTYQSDLFNNWINTEWIDGENGISAITAINVVDSKFTIDELNIHKKVYDMLNRIAISGGSYEDWQEAVFGENALRRAESPIYMGGASAEIVFEEVVSTADSETTLAGEQPLGTLAGKGTLAGYKGGSITIKVKEPSIIMGIVSITPRIDYNQGNKWFLTELDNMNDLHKPALDGIGFQPLMTEQMAWFDVTIDDENILSKMSAGKQPAWINYMTNVNEVYGTFCDRRKMGNMVLTREYESYKQNNTNIGGIQDLTTYIDPRKYTYAFATTELDEQPFMVQIGKKVIARRKMSAKQIPNL